MNGNIPSGANASEWRDRARYDRLTGFDQATWAWECLRRAIGKDCQLFREAGGLLLRAEPPICLLNGDLCDWTGTEPLPLAIFKDCTDFAGHVFWRAAHHPPVLVVRAHPSDANKAGSALFDLARLPYPAVVLQVPGRGEYVLIAEGSRCIRMKICSGTVLSGPVSLEFLVAGDHAFEVRILSLRRLAAFHRLGRFPRSLFPPERRARRWARALQAWDGRKAGASHREIASVLYGHKAVRHDWYGPSDYQRTHVRRLLQTADGLIRGGWRKLLW